jgi:primosomal protein N' (replication factor Y)
MHYKVQTNLPITLCVSGSAELLLGDMVYLTIRNKQCIGVIWNYCNEVHSFALVQCTYIISLSEQYVQFAKTFCYINCCSAYRLIKNIQQLYSTRAVKHLSTHSHNYISSIQLSTMQQQCVAQFHMNCHIPVLLWGVTGSGKTECALTIALHYLNQHKQVLILVPEIALTENLVARWQKYFTVPIVTWNSNSKNKTKFMQILTGTASIVIGTRSAILLPYKALGVIIIDEEHDRSYKQLTDLQYSAVHAATMRNVPVLLMSATPSLQSLYLVTIKQYALITLRNKYHNSNVKITNVFTPVFRLFSDYALERIQQEITKKHQVMVLLNRRGFAHTLICSLCSERQQCLNCHKNLIWHYNVLTNKSSLLCHICRRQYDVNVCNQCHAKRTIKMYGYGVEKIASMLTEKISTTDSHASVAIQIFDSDYCNTEQKINEMINKIKAKQVDIIIGTQMLSKGHDFADLSLAIIFMHNLCSYDFRMYETMMQNLMQISGRVGRANKDAEVIIQTSDHAKYDLSTASYEKFLYDELERRKQHNLPPYVKSITIRLIKHSNNCLSNIQNIISNYCTSTYKMVDHIVAIIEHNMFDAFLHILHNQVLLKYKVLIDIE